MLTFSCDKADILPDGPNGPDVIIPGGSDGGLPNAEYVSGQERLYPGSLVTLSLLEGADSSARFKDSHKVFLQYNSAGASGTESKPVFIATEIVERSAIKCVFQIPLDIRSSAGGYQIVICAGDPNLPDMPMITSGWIMVYPPVPTAPQAWMPDFAQIVDAKTLFITGASTSGMGVKQFSSNADNLFKVTKNNQTLPVDFTSKDGHKLDSVNVRFIKNMSDKYLYMSYDYVTEYDTVEMYEGDSIRYLFVGQDEHAQVIVRKTDGAIFKIDPKSIPGGYGDVIDSETEFQVDYNENVYFTGYYNETLYKIYTHGNEVFIAQINRDGMGRNSWVVDRRGNVIINDDYARLVSGEFARLPTNSNRYYRSPTFINYMDSEGFLQMRGDHSMNENKLTLYIDFMQAQAPDMKWVEHRKLSDELANDVQFKGSYTYYNKCCTAFTYKDKTIIRFHNENGQPYGSDVLWTVVLNNKNDIREVQSQKYDMPADVVFSYYGTMNPCSETYLYGMSRSEIWRMEIETGKPEMLYRYNNEFDIKSIDVRNNIVTFRAFELRRGIDVVGEIYPDKTVKIIESINNDKIIYLERIN